MPFSYLKKYLYFTLLFVIFRSSSICAQTPKIDSLLHLLATQPGDTTRINTLNTLALTYMYELSDTRKVGEISKELLGLSEKLHHKKGIAWAYLHTGIYRKSIGETDTAIAYIKKSLELMISNGDKLGESSCYSSMGYNYSNLGEYEQAFHYLFKALHMKQQLNDKAGIAGIYNSIGNIYYYKGDYSKSVTYYFMALKIQEEIGNNIGMMKCYTNIGNVFLAQNKRDEALNNYFKAVKINERTNYQKGVAGAYMNIGEVYCLQKKYQEGLEYYYKALQAYEATANKRFTALTLSNIGDVYLKLHRPKEALPYLTKGLHMLENTGDKKGLTDVRNILGNAYEENGNYKEALKCYEEMLVLSNQIEYKEGLRDAYENFSLFYKRQEQFEKALAYTILFNNMKDSLLNKENFKQVSELNTRYETDKKEKEILLLTKDQQLKAKVIKQQQLVRWGLIIGLILLFISVFSIYRRYRFKQKAHILLQQQKKEIQEKNLLITDSIDYAKNIQEAVFPTSEEIKNHFPNSFLLYKPKSVVSGDFYWIHCDKERLTLAIADCTGHGVPGAFMSLLGYNMLENEIKKDVQHTTGMILNSLNEEMIHHLHKNGQTGDNKHGMDISLVCIDTSSHTLQFSGAHHSLYIIRNKQLIELKGNKKGIGFNDSHHAPFTDHTFQLEKGDLLYAFTDGFPDQIGGGNRKKFFYQPFKDLLISICELPLEDQQKRLDQAHTEWMGTRMDQTDDILILGIRYEI